MTALLRALAAAAIRRHFYPDNHGRPIRRDPTHGKVDRDLQWNVQRFHPGLTVGQRVVLELRAQQARDERAGRLKATA